MTHQTNLEKAKELIVKLRLGIMATPGVITVKDEWRYEMIAQALDTLEKETIERCAQTAKDYNHKFRSGESFSVAVICCDMIAKAIRAMNNLKEVKGE